ncbi:MAG: hypothetical protein WD069_04145 [Planctomycetales bacterium]
MVVPFDQSRARGALAALLLACVAGCAEDSVLPPGHAELRKALGENGMAAIASDGGRITVVSLRDAGIRDIRPLAGLPLVALDLTGLPVADLAPLEGMPLEELFLNDTPVADLSPLAGMRLRRLELRNTRVTDIRPLAGMPLASLDLSGTPLADIEAAKTFRGLERLNIADTEIADLAPLTGLSLKELIFTPSRIERGLEAIRGMGSLEVLDVRRREGQQLAPADFWGRHDAGEFAD